MSCFFLHTFFLIFFLLLHFFPLIIVFIDVSTCPTLHSCHSWHYWALKHISILPLPQHSKSSCYVQCPTCLPMVLTILKKIFKKTFCLKCEINKKKTCDYYYFQQQHSSNSIFSLLIASKDVIKFMYKIRKMVTRK